MPPAVWLVSSLIEEFGGLAVEALADVGVEITVPLLLEIMEMRNYRDAYQEWMRDNKSERVSEHMKQKILRVKQRVVEQSREKKARRRAYRERVRSRQRRD